MPQARQVLNFIDGRYTEGTSRETFEIHDPADDSLAAQVYKASRHDVDEAVSAARRAFHGPWAGLRPEERHELLRQTSDAILARREDFIAAEISDSGHPYGQVSTMEIPRGAEQFRLFADIAAAGDTSAEFKTPTPDGREAVNRTQRVPKGVLACICPWNFPLVMATWKAAPALAWGNTVVLKPSEESPSTAALLGQVMNDVGMPPGVFNVVHGFGPDCAGEFLVSHPGVDAINFTGESATGEVIMRSASVGLRDVTLELGGKNAAIILDDANLEEAVEGTARSVLFNTGQVCLCTERVYVARPLLDEFVTRLTAAAEARVLGDPRAKTTNFGPLVSETHREKVLACYDQARNEGADVITGGGVPDMPDTWRHGAWVQPTIWMGLEESSRTVREEIFGPCCSVRAFDDDQEAINLANDTRYGLAATVWSGNAARAQAVAERVNAGVVWVNCWLVRDLRTPFGGFGKSGIGREGGTHSLEFHTELKNICTL